MSAGNTTTTYEWIKVTDPSKAVWVSPLPADSYETNLERVKKEEIDQNYRNTYLILIGPTGSGKSSFIEAIASRSTREPLGIAKDQLESVTQQSCIYEIMNLRVTSGGSKIYIIDTPGFADPRISEFQVLDKLTYWRDRCQQTKGTIRLLYFHPITDIRMPASRRLCLDMVGRFWGKNLGARTLLVTSFWDCVPSQSRTATEERFSQLSTSHWGGWVEVGSSASKFENTFDSAMDIINRMCQGKSKNEIHPDVSGLGMEGTTGNPVYEALSSRLSSLEQQRETLREHLAHPASQGQTELIDILTNELEKVESLLQKFTAEMEDFIGRLNPPQATQTPHSTEVIDIDAAPAAGVADEAIDLTLPKRFSRWVHKKADKMHFGQRKGA